MRRQKRAPARRPNKVRPAARVTTVKNKEVDDEEGEEVESIQQPGLANPPRDEPSRVDANILSPDKNGRNRNVLGVIIYVLYKYVCCPKKDENAINTLLGRPGYHDAKTFQEMIEVKKKEEERAMKEAINRQDRLDKELLLEEIKAQKIEDVGLEIKKLAEKRQKEKKKTKDSLKVKTNQLEKMAKLLEEERMLEKKIEFSRKKMKRRRKRRVKKKEKDNFYID
ncbi:hypothetical protein HELRODRAFT_165161 [Helobdella robusta]|uniref:Uncharacterized protein n=1 Tax=Helobdella robusta TaxID=6412 RepID=T1EWC7_HELRO|nr:hypothetical protein HELRODRAFT_165161 [Helobdella robusta]ESN93006.1 hypothetical protein HELRODRAFT_165161 [Helobdella robusta]